MVAQTANLQGLVEQQTAFQEVFPFFFIIDKQLCIIQCGERFSALCMNEAPTPELKTILELKHPLLTLSASKLVDHYSQLFIWESNLVPGFQIRGEFVNYGAEDHFLFAGSPWIEKLEDLNRFGLHLTDFPSHDTLVDLLVLKNLKGGALEEAQKMSTSLTEAISTIESRNAFFKAIVHNTLDIISVVDKNLKIIYHTNSLSRLLSADKTLAGRRITDFVHSDDKHYFEQTLNVLAAEQNAHENIRINLTNEEGGVITVEATIRNALNDPHVKGFIINASDVSERIHLQELMIQSEKMLTVGGLAAGMAHEINNPLAGVIQNAQVLSNRLNLSLDKNIEVARQAGTTADQIKQYLNERNVAGMIEAILESGKRASDIVKNMLNFSRKSGSLLVPQDLAELLDKTLELLANDYNLKRHYDFKCLNVQREYDPSMPMVPCESTEIQQVILNLLKNAAHSLESSKPSTPTIWLRLSSQRKAACIEIEDNGFGMDEETKRHIFEPFFTTKTAGKGTGLGLSLSYFIVTQRHKGQIKVDSSPGKGCRFTITLPL